MVSFLDIPGLPSLAGTFQPGQHHQLPQTPDSPWSPRVPLKVRGGGALNSLPLSPWPRLLPPIPGAVPGGWEGGDSCLLCCWVAGPRPGAPPAPGLSFPT